MARTLSPDIIVPYPVLSLCEIRVEETSQVIGPESAQAQDGIRYRRPYTLMREVVMKNGRLHQAASQIVGVISPVMPMHPIQNSWVHSIPVIIEGWEIGTGGSRNLETNLYSPGFRVRLSSAVPI
ncbi:MAG: hypothetical protein VX824_10495 [Pseudomonadota bacterium]|nr:hypothetical protein [Pseudomonadota bacterium]